MPKLTDMGLPDFHPFITNEELGSQHFYISHARNMERRDGAEIKQQVAFTVALPSLGMDDEHLRTLTLSWTPVRGEMVKYFEKKPSKSKADYIGPVQLEKKRNTAKKLKERGGEYWEFLEVEGPSAKDASATAASDAPAPATAASDAPTPTAT